MPANEIFVDASALIAIINRVDALHEPALTLHRQLNRLKQPLVTSDWVLSEFLSGTSHPNVRLSAAGLIQALRSSTRTIIIEATRPEWDRAFEFYCLHKDKRWSLIDCSSMLICKDRGITRVFTSDRHFVQFGLEILLELQTR